MFLEWTICKRCWKPNKTTRTFWRKRTKKTFRVGVGNEIVEKAADVDLDFHKTIQLK